MCEEAKREREVLVSYQIAVSQQCSTAARKAAECCRPWQEGDGAKPEGPAFLRGRTGQATFGWRVWGALWSSWPRNLSQIPVNIYLGHLP